MRAQIHSAWRDFKALPAGERFQHVHERQKGSPIWVKVVVIAGAVVAFGIAVLLTVLPGPAFVFFGLSGALLAVESARVARLLDKAEVAARERIGRVRRWRSQRRHSARERARAARSS